MNTEPGNTSPDRRDAEILTVLGVFLVVLAVPVLIGTYWAEGTVPRLVNIAAALIIGGIGGGMVWRGRRRP